MLTKVLSFGMAALPIGFAGIVAFHPGVVDADSKSMVLEQTKTGAYAVDPNHTSVSFEIGHMGIAKVHGRFTDFSGTVMFDEAKVENSTVEFTIQAKSVDTAIAARDNHLRTADFFDVEKYPTLSFKSHHVTKSDKGYIVVGDLTMMGKTKSVSIPFTLGGPIDMRGVQTLGVIAEPITIKRSEFGMTYGLGEKPAISDEVVIRLSAEANKK